MNTTGVSPFAIPADVDGVSVFDAELNTYVQALATSVPNRNAINNTFLRKQQNPPATHRDSDEDAKGSHRNALDDDDNVIQDLPAENRYDSIISGLNTKNDDTEGLYYQSRFDFDTTGDNGDNAGAREGQGETTAHLRNALSVV